MSRTSKFQPGDRVVCVNTDVSSPIHGPLDGGYQLPDGPPRRETIYCVDRIDPGEPDSVWICGLRALHHGREIPWHASRWRKVEPRRQRSRRRRRESAPALA